ncbi:MAG: GNAT family protein [Gemmatimonadaceae bacterium]
MPETVELTGKVVRLEPLRIEHLDGLCRVGLDPAIWRWMPVHVRDREGMRAFIDDALKAAETGEAVPFAIRRLSDGDLVGSTRFMSIVRMHRRVEIGGTWITPSVQRSAVNTECKLLLLEHAFDVWRCQRVEFKTNALNRASRDAILRLGAREEGTFRKHMMNDDGTSRDSVYFSIVDDEWPGIRARLLQRLAAGAV